MKKSHITIPVLFLIFAIIFTGCSRKLLTEDADRSFQAYTSELFKSEVSTNTLNLHYTLKDPKKYQILKYPVTLGTFYTDPTALQASLENALSVLDNIPYRALSKENRITYDILSSTFSLSREGAKYLLYEEPLNSVTGIQAQLPVLLAEYTFSGKEDVRIYLQLLQTLPAYFDSLIDFEKEKSKHGLFMNTVNAEKVIEQCNAFLSMGKDSYLLSTFEDRLADLGLSERERKSYISKNKQILSDSVEPAYTNLINALKELKNTGKNDLGLCYFPNGKTYYEYLVKEETGSSRSVRSQYTLFREQMRQDLQDLQSIVKQHPDIASKNLIDLENNPEKILCTLKAKIADAFPPEKAVETAVKYVPGAMEEYLSPAFYLIPAIDNTAPNVIYINRGRLSTDITLFTTLAHEGYPGHLYQHTYFASRNPDPIRLLYSFGGYTEGWATYAEMCSYYLSPLDRASAGLLQKNASLMLGVYAFCDIGIHYYGWNQDKTAQFLSRYGIETPDVVYEIFHYILADPANYLKYYAGYLEFLELKKEAIRSLGNDFSQIQFHKMVLDIGPAPFDIIRKYLPF